MTVSTVGCGRQHIVLESQLTHATLLTSVQHEPSPFGAHVAPAEATNE